MNCDFCSDTATIFLTQVTGEELKKICLCEDCSRNKELMTEKGLIQAFADNLIPLAGDGNDIGMEDVTMPSLSCECGFSLGDLSSTGRLGCSECYHTFQDVLEGKILSLHRGGEHTGKEIEIPIDKKSLEKKIAKIKGSLEDAINSEDFELAASLRDDLKRLEGDLLAL